MLVYIGVILWNTYKPLPEGISYEGDIHWTDDVEMFTDLTYAQNKDGEVWCMSWQFSMKSTQ